MTSFPKARVNFGECAGEVGEIINIIHTQAGPVYCLYFQNTETHPYDKKQLEFLKEE